MNQNRQVVSPVAAAAVYLLQRWDGIRFKVGWASDPMTRATQLPEFALHDLDLGNSYALWLPSWARARQVERSMHRALQPFRLPATHRGDGYSEWYRGDACPAAIRMLRYMPAANAPSLSAPLVSFRTTRENVPTGCDTAGPREAWSSLEDLLWRWSTSRPIAVTSDGDQTLLVFPRFRHLYASPFDDLRRNILDISRYEWKLGRQRGHFVARIEYSGDDLVYRFTPMRVIAQWPFGAELASELRTLLIKLRQRGDCAL